MIRENKDLNEQCPALYNNKPNKSKSLLLPHINLSSPLVHSHKSVLGFAVACLQHSKICPCVAFQVKQFNGPLAKC